MRNNRQQHSNVVFVHNTKSPPTEKRKRRLNLRMILVLIFLLWAGYTYLFVQLPRLERMNEERNTLQQQLNTLESQQTQMQQQVSDLNSDDYIARLARKYYNMMKSGEIIYRPEKTSP